MIFQEKKKDIGFTYDIEDVFGKVHIDSKVKLTAELLDGIITLLLRQNGTAKVITGSVKTEKGEIEYRFVKASQWEPDDEIEPCENTPTSTKKQESESTQTRSYVSATGLWFRRFVAAFREAWKKSYPQRGNSKN